MNGFQAPSGRHLWANHFGSNLANHPPSSPLRGPLLRSLDSLEGPIVAIDRPPLTGLRGDFSRPNRGRLRGPPSPPLVNPSIPTPRRSNAIGEPRRIGRSSGRLSAGNGPRADPEPTGKSAVHREASSAGFQPATSREPTPSRLESRRYIAKVGGKVGGTSRSQRRLSASNEPRATPSRLESRRYSKVRRSACSAGFQPATGRGRPRADWKVGGTSRSK